MTKNLRIRAFFLLILLLVLLPACGGKSDPAAAPTPEGGFKEEDITYSESQGMELNPETGRDKYLTDPVPEGKPLPVDGYGIPLHSLHRLQIHTEQYGQMQRE